MTRPRPPVRRRERPALRRARPARALLALLLLGLGPALASCPDPNLGRLQPDIVVDETPLDFGALPVLNPRSLGLDVSNQGGARLDLSSVTIEGDGAAAFSVADVPAGIDPAGRSTLALTFRPEAEQAYAATLVIASNDPDTPEVRVDLTGEGSTVACIEVEPAAIDFGLVGEGQTAVESLTLRAGCTAPLLVEDVRFSDDTPPEFEPVGSWGTGTIDVGQEIPLSVAFRPKVGQQVTTGTILITSADPNQRVVEVPLTAQIDRAPVADCGQASVAAAPGDTVSFDGSASYDPEGETPLTYDWRVDKRPLDSNTEIPDPTAEVASLDLDVAGSWEVSLGVTDASGIPSAERCRVEVRAIPAEKLYVELIWDNAVTDLDLHFLAPGGTVGGAGDCWWGTPGGVCDFGAPGDASDDPTLNRDDLAGFGPEIVTYADPAPGTYRIAVDFSKANGAADPTSLATVRVFEFGVIVAEISHTLGAPGTLWNVATVDWPSGDVSAVDKVTTY